MNLLNNFKFLLVAVVLFTSFGCTNFLETSIDTNTTPETVATDRSSLWNFANAFYSPMTYGFSVIDNNIFAAATDEAQQTSVSANVNYFNQGTINASANPLSYLYKNYYEGIRAANFFLNYAKNGEALLKMNRDTLTDVTNYKKDKDFLKWYRAEAHVAKAYYYGELIKMYGDVPIVEQTLDNANSAKIVKTSYDQVVAYIVNEIDTYKKDLVVSWKTSSYTDQDGRFTLGSALAIKARVLLYAASPLHNPTNDVEKWKIAASAANDIITNSGLGYSLHTDYRKYFLGKASLTSTETILAIRRAVNNDIEARNYPIATAGGESGVTPSQNLVADYEYIGTPDVAYPYKNRDPRLDASVVTNGSTWNTRTIDEAPGGSDDMTKANASRTGYYLKKFLTDNVNLTQGSTVQNQWVVYRYGEVLLNYAEAMNEAYGPDANAGNTLTARQALNLVRNRASASLPAVTVTTIPDFRAVLKHERKIELAFEDHRYWDLLRWKDAKTVLNQPIKGVKVTKNNSGIFVYEVVNVTTRTFNDRNYYLPFMRSEIENSKGTLIQNESY